MHFFLPFFTLLSAGLKKNASRLAVVAGLLFALRYVDLFWNIAPIFKHEHFSVHPFDLLMPVAVGGICSTSSPFSSRRNRFSSSMTPRFTRWRSLPLMHTEPSQQPSNPEIRYEKTDAHPRPLYHFLFWISVVCLFTAAFSWAVFAWMKTFHGSSSERASMAPAADTQQPPGPKLQTREPQDLAAFQKEEQEILTTYGVVDREKGLFRIPIEEAMRLTLQRGLPAAGDSVPAAAATPKADAKVAK